MSVCPSSWGLNQPRDENGKGTMGLSRDGVVVGRFVWECEGKEKRKYKNMLFGGSWRLLANVLEMRSLFQQHLPGAIWVCGLELGMKLSWELVGGVREKQGAHMPHAGTASL